jgi:hypothetical protein
MECMKSLLLLFWFLSLFIVKALQDPPTRGSRTFSVAGDPIQKRMRSNKRGAGELNNKKLKKKPVVDLPSLLETKRLIRDHLRKSAKMNSKEQYTPALKEYANDTASYIEDMKLIKNISLLTNPNNETRVISFALYGKKPKYNLGAIYNVEMAKVYFPGWKCRFYVADDAMKLTVNILKDLGAEIEYIPPGMGRMMFWRFMVADDPTVDRYIIRDVDSRLNSRDR